MQALLTSFSYWNLFLSHNCNTRTQQLKNGNGSKKILWVQTDKHQIVLMLNKWKVKLKLRNHWTWYWLSVHNYVQALWEHSVLEPPCGAPDGSVWCCQQRADSPLTVVPTQYAWIQAGSRSSLLNCKIFSRASSVVCDQTWFNSSQTLHVCPLGRGS